MPLGSNGSQTRWNGYMVFCTYTRKKIQRENPNLPAKDITSMLGRKWATSTDLEKEKWREEAEKLNQLEREKSNATVSSF